MLVSDFNLNNIYFTDMSNNWFGCLTDSCLEDKRYENSPQYAQLAAREIQMIQGQYAYPNNVGYPQVASQPQIIPAAQQIVQQPASIIKS